MRAIFTRHAAAVLAVGLAGARLVLLLTTLLALHAPARAQDAGPDTVGRASDAVPKITIGYSALFDGACADLSGQPLDSARVAIVRRREGDYAAMWSARGPSLLATAREVMGVPFRFREERVTLSTCWPGSMNFPLIIRVGSVSQVGIDSATAEVLFVGTLFHELLHRYINDRRMELPNEPTPLVAKYAHETFRVRNHLHLLALQRLVYERLGLDAELRLIMAHHRTSSDAAVMGRVHDIVAAEGAEALVNELRPAASLPTRPGAPMGNAAQRRDGSRQPPGLPPGPF